MIPLSWPILLTSSIFRVIAYPEPSVLRSWPSRQLQKRNASIQASSPFDHSWIEAYASLGDSYAVGVGAGHYIQPANGLILNQNCYQYSYGYPNLLNANDMIGVNPNRMFQYLGCSGALVPDVRDKQVPMMSQSQLVTLSVGGNDINFASILNYCVYQWATFWGWSCDGELANAKAIVEADQYTNDLNSLIQAISKKLQGANSRIYWIAYVRFWDDTTKDCDSVTWSLTRNIGFRQYLTQARRTAMNDLVDSVNSQIKSVCEAAPQCVYVETNDGIDLLGGHFCEPGVDESYHWLSGGVSANREETWPYEWGTNKDDDQGGDKDIDQPQKRSDVPGNLNNAKFEGAIANWIALGLAKGEIDPNISATLQGDGNYTTQGDYYLRLFHLNKFANGAVAMRILNAMDAEQAKMMNQPAVTTTISICDGMAAATASSTSASATTSANVCVGNQIEGPCAQGSEPSAAPDSGPEAPVCNKVDATTNQLVRINSDKASKAATDYCANLISNGVVLGANGPPPNPGLITDAAENGGSLALSVVFDAASCAPNTADQDQKIDFARLGQQNCEMDLFTAISAVCSQDPTWPNYNADYTLEGGVAGLDCGLWALTGQPA